MAKLNLASPRVDSRVRPSPSNRDLCRRTFYIDRTPLETPTRENILYIYGNVFCSARTVCEFVLEW